MKRTAFHIFRTGAIGVLLVLAGIGCTSVSKSIFSTSVSVHQDKGFLLHQVKWEGETLSILAKWYTGSLDNWKVIAEANPALDPNRIIIGNAIRIPSGLLITRKPMPKTFLTVDVKTDSGPAPAERDRPKPAASPVQAEPVTAPVPPDAAATTALPQKEYSPLAAPLSLPEKRPTGSGPDSPGESPDSPAAKSSVQPGSEKKPEDAKVGQPAGKEEEPPLFGPKGYHN